MKSLERCPACRARLGEAAVCVRCGSDFSLTRRAERQAQDWVRVAILELSAGNTQQAAQAADTASALTSSLLARVVARTIARRTSD